MFHWDRHFIIQAHVTSGNWNQQPTIRYLVSTPHRWQFSFNGPKETNERIPSGILHDDRKYFKEVFYTLFYWLPLFLLIYFFYGEKFVYFQLLKWAVLLWIRRLTLVLKELKFKFIFSNIHTRFWVIPKWMGRPKGFVAQIAGILQPLNVLLNVLFHMTKHLRCVIAVGAVVPFSPLFDHWLNSCHGIRWNDWILL